MESVDPSILVSEPAAGVLELRFNKSRTGNALSTELLEHLVARLESSAEDERIRVVITTGGPVLFSVGAEISEICSPVFDEDAALFRCQLYRHLAKYPKPFIAAVCGPALGGGFEIALAADIIVAGSSARFGLPETALGIIPAGGGTQRLIRTAGKSLAMQMTLAGKELTAQEAKQAGIVSEVVDDCECLPRARAIAEAIAKRPPNAVSYAKKSVLESFEQPLDHGLLLEQEYYARLRGIRIIK